MSSEECLLHFPRWMIHRGDRHSLCLSNVQDIAQREDLGGVNRVNVDFGADINKQDISVG